VVVPGSGGAWLGVIDVGSALLGSNGAHDPHVEWSVTTVKHGAEAQPTPAKTQKLPSMEKDAFISYDSLVGASTIQ